MDYFSFIPFELIELIISYLNDSELVSFFEVYDVKDFINWTNVYTLHFLQFKSVGYGEYFTFLSVERLKGELKLKETVEELINLEKLDLRSSGIEKIPKEIGELVKLKELNLFDNQITEIPPEIGKLINLKELNLSFNKIKEIPKEIGHLINLKELYLYNNQIINFPEEIGNLTNLKILDLDNNKFPIPSEIGNLLPNTLIYY